jgi:hypothetical protein
MRYSLCIKHPTPDVVLLFYCAPLHLRSNSQNSLAIPELDTANPRLRSTLHYLPPEPNASLAATSVKFPLLHPTVVDRDRTEQRDRFIQFFRFCHNARSPEVRGFSTLALF